MEEHVEISVMEGLGAVADLVTEELTAKQVKFMHARSMLHTSVFSILLNYVENYCYIFTVTVKSASNGVLAIFASSKKTNDSFEPLAVTSLSLHVKVVRTVTEELLGTTNLNVMSYITV